MQTAPPPNFTEPRPSGTRVLVHDATVRIRAPWLVATLATLTVGIGGVVSHGRLNRELRDVGRARGAMPFPFIHVSPGSARVAYLLGVIGWMITVAILVDYGISLADGYAPSAADITDLAPVVALLTPLWLTMLHTARRVATAQHLVGYEGSPVEPWRVALTAAVFPPAGTWVLQRAANRAWRVWGGAHA